MACVMCVYLGSFFFKYIFFSGYFFLGFRWRFSEKEIFIQIFTWLYILMVSHLYTYSFCCCCCCCCSGRHQTTNKHHNLYDDIFIYPSFLEDVFNVQTGRIIIVDSVQRNNVGPIWMCIWLLRRAFLEQN